ncbi:MAG: hypothetical protein JSU63_12555 [Phycisphaerales bacterium]|nr:MAG: hypothetical protein JSU63_12555 [Phycisphaerales bacterium]
MATLVVLPALVLSPLTAQALVIHNHHGHDTHGHTVALCDLDDLQENSEHQHEKHEHDGVPVEPTEDEDTAIQLVLDLPEGLARSRVLSSSYTAVAGGAFAPRTNVVASVTQQSDHSYSTFRSSLAPPLRARGLLESILLTNRALLL